MRVLVFIVGVVLLNPGVEAVVNECHSCIGVACQTSSTPTLCTPAADNCYTMFTVTETEFTVTEKGCADSTTACTGLTCRMCSGSDNCNANDKTPQEIECLDCLKGAVDCTSTPASVLTFANCDVDTHKCFTRLESEQGKTHTYTSRGCIDKSTAESATLVACATPKCNNKILPENRRTCNTQSGTERCLSPADDCYYKYDTSTSTPQASSGCNKMLDESPNCPPGDSSCASCAGDGCNSNLCHVQCKGTGCEPTASSCIPETGKGCVTKIEGTMTKYGCQTNEVCDGNVCVTCHTAYCNYEALFPTQRLKCHHCDGTDPTCKDAIANDALATTCLNYVENDQCYVKSDGGKIKRGCLSDLQDPATDCVDGSCVKCSNGACNKVGYLEPTKCVICGSVLGCSLPIGQTPKSCDILIPDGGVLNKCYTTFKDSVPETRGCLPLANLPESLKKCQTDDLINKPHCKTCVGSGCNTDTRPDAIECLKCDIDSLDCTRSPSSITVLEPCLLTTSVCHSSVDATSLKISRGCTTTPATCSDPEKCVLCTDKSKCNSAAVPATRRTCKKGANTEICLKVTDDCYLKEDGTDGCNTLESGALACTVSTGKCATCSTDHCNSYLCNAGCKGDGCTPTANPFCIPAADSQCITKIDGKKTLRGCDGKLADCPATDATCKLCNSGNCNSEVFPSTRLQCHKCAATATDCGNAITNPLKSEACDNYLATGDKCYVKLEADNKISRGCLSDIAEPGTNCKDGTCHKCDASGCNSIAGLSDATLKCYQCDEKTPGCGKELKTETVKSAVCKSKVFIGQEQKCFAYKKKTLRGCVLDMAAADDECTKGDSCQICAVADCNTQDSSSTRLSTGIHLAIFSVLAVLAIQFY